MDSTFTLKLIRHAPTAGNLDMKYIGWTDEPAVPFKAEPDFTIRDVWGSDLRRCRQTARQLFPAARYHEDADWRECHFGRWEGKTYAQLETVKMYRRWIDDPFSFTPPGGESLPDVSVRIGRAVRSLPEHEEHIVVTHGGPVRLLLAQATGAPFREQVVRHGFCYTLVWRSREEFEEGKRCISCSAAPVTANGIM